MYSTRFGTAATKVVIGVVNGRVTVVEQRVSDGACQSQQIAPGPALSNHVHFFAGDGPNRVRVVQSAWEVSTPFCGVVATPIQTGVFLELIVKAGGGDDIVLSSGSTSVWAGEGNDVIISYDSASGHRGEGGDDYMIELGDFGKIGFLGGGFGNDRLCDLTNGSFMRGDPGTDLVWNAAGGDTTEGSMPSSDECQFVAFLMLVTQDF